ncbi:MAG: AMP-binding protein [Hyphomicrobiales bacterium]|nr:AMP-binding protein [Hyphomicrobiales bacterium]
MRIEQSLRNNAIHFSDKTALIAGSRRFTYNEIDRLSDRLAASLVSCGVERGNRVVIYMDNCWQAVISIYAVFKVGAVVSLVNPSTKTEKLAFILNNSRATALLAQSRLLEIAQAAAKEAPSVTVKLVTEETGNRTTCHFGSFEKALEGGSAVALPDPGIDIDLAMLIYTSGSTGFPKGVMMTHRSVNAAAGSITTYLENTPDDVIMCVVPVSFDYGLYQVLMSIRTGATLVLEKSFAFPYAIMKKMVEEKVTGFPIVPTMAALILQMKDIGPDAVPNLRYISSTAAALHPSVISRLRQMFENTEIHSMYGLTECKRCTWMPPEHLDRKPASVGKAIPGTEAYVVDKDGNPVAAGITGELVIRGAHVMSGYWENPEATARALRTGRHPWEKVLYTGDLFYADEEGYLYFVSRKDDIIKTRGEKVSPREIENVLYAMPEIREAVVTGITDPILGSAIKALVVTVADANVSEKEVQRHCARHLEDFMVPHVIEFRSHLLKSDNGKISHRMNKDTLEAAQ